MATKCPKCHSESPDTLKFCADCGTQLTPPADAAAIVLVCPGFLLGGGGVPFSQEEKKAPERETLSGPQGFPYYHEVGEKLSDGFILSIAETQVIFRKTNERGIPLTKPKNMVKEINPEER